MLHLNWEEKRINRIGQVLIFIAFFLITPELLGEEKLKRIASTLSNKKVRDTLTVITITTVIITFAIILGALSVLDANSPHPTGLTILVGLPMAVLSPLPIFFGFRKLDVAIQKFADAHRLRSALFAVGVLFYCIGSALVFIDA